MTTSYPAFTTDSLIQQSNQMLEEASNIQKPDRSTNEILEATPTQPNEKSLLRYNTLKTQQQLEEDFKASANMPSEEVNGRRNLFLDRSATSCSTNYCTPSSTSTSSCTFNPHHSSKEFAAFSLQQMRDMLETSHHQSDSLMLQLLQQGNMMKVPIYGYAYFDNIFNTSHLEQHGPVMTLQEHHQQQCSQGNQVTERQLLDQLAAYSNNLSGSQCFDIMTTKIPSTQTDVEFVLSQDSTLAFQDLDEIKQIARDLEQLTKDDHEAVAVDAEQEHETISRRKRKRRNSSPVTLPRKLSSWARNRRSRRNSCSSSVRTNQNELQEVPESFVSLCEDGLGRTFVRDYKNVVRDIYEHTQTVDDRTMIILKEEIPRYIEAESSMFNKWLKNLRELVSTNRCCAQVLAQVQATRKRFRDRKAKYHKRRDVVSPLHH